MAPIIRPTPLGVANGAAAETARADGDEELARLCVRQRSATRGVGLAGLDSVVDPARRAPTGTRFKTRADLLSQSPLAGRGRMGAKPPNCRRAPVV